MATLQSSIQIKNRSVKGPTGSDDGLGTTDGGRNGAGAGSTTVTTGGGGLKKYKAVKNAGLVPSPGVEKTNAAS